MEPEVEATVRRVVARVVAEGAACRAAAAPPAAAPAPPLVKPLTTAPPSPAGRRVVEAAEVAALAPGAELVVPASAVWTPLARDLARERRIRVRALAAEGAASTVALGSDHGGFRLKAALRAWLEARQVRVADVGTHSDAACDYPDFALDVARAVARGNAAFGVMIDGAGIGSAMVGNRVPGVLAALCGSVDAARNAREHNFANMLTLGAKGLTEGDAFAIVAAFLETPEGEPRHRRRVEKIRALDTRWTAAP